jgi:toxin YoeB
MKLIFAAQAWADYLYWQQTDPKIMKRIHELIKETGRNPTEGIGKPEPLRYALAGYWSRRITGEHRMVYKPTADGLLIAQLRYHYS